MPDDLSLSNRTPPSHYTDIEMVKYLLSAYPISVDDSILDAGSGMNKVWYNCANNSEKYECEIERGNDFYEFNKRVDWVIGNPPFKEFPEFLFKAVEIANKGICFLASSDKLIHFTTKRLQRLKDKGFFINKLIVVNDKRWFGRYYYIIITKEDKGFIDWNNKIFGSQLTSERSEE